MKLVLRLTEFFKSGRVWSYGGEHCTAQTHTVTEREARLAQQRARRSALEVLVN